MKLKKLNIMKTRPEISDQEIQSMMDFDKVLNQHRIAQKSSNVAKYVAVISGVAALLIGGWFYFKPDEQPQIVEKIQKETPVAADSVSKQEEEPIIEEKRPVTQAKEPSKTEPAKAAPADVYAEAEPLNGYPDLYEYFHKELKYPQEVLKDSLEGIVSVQFIISKQGRPEQIKILQSLGTPFDNEAIRVISGMPEWKPASLNGKPVPARISMPLTFTITRTNQP